jgi:hypothetical protein
MKNINKRHFVAKIILIFIIYKKITLNFKTNLRYINIYLVITSLICNFAKYGKTYIKKKEEKNGIQILY